MIRCPLCSKLLASQASMGGHFAWRHADPELLATSATIGAWVERAACLGKTDLFFPEPPLVARHASAAKAICATCPVLAECRRWALDTGEEHGVWGGMTPHERRRVRWPSKAAR